MRDVGVFDSVIVGGGSAGCVLANRLSVSGEHRALLLKAGGEDRNRWMLVRPIMEAPALLAYIAGDYEPGPDYANDDDLPRYMRERASTIYHPTCTCRMGEDHGVGVVDARPRVQCVGRLRVVNGSVALTVVSGNTNAAIIMVSESAAGMILEDALCPPLLARAAAF